MAINAVGDQLFKLMNFYRTGVVLLSSVLAVGSLVAAESLRWDQRSIELTTTPGQKTVQVAFPFTNASDQQITIQSVTPSCDCTTAELKKKTFAPGETGKIDVVFDVAGSKGPQFKTITVTTDENPSEPIDLVLKVHIPELVKIAPRFLSWRVGS